jgi:hypothetical protein
MLSGNAAASLARGVLALMLHFLWRHREEPRWRSAVPKEGQLLARSEIRGGSAPTRTVAERLRGHPSLTRRPWADVQVLAQSHVA